MTTTATPTGTTHTVRSVSSPVAVGCTLLALGSFGFMAAGILTGAEPGRDGFLHPLNAPAEGIAALGATILALSLANWRPTTLPRWTTLMAAAGMVFIVVIAWNDATTVVATAHVIPEDDTFLDIANSGWGMAMYVPKMLLHLVAFGTLAVVGWRTGEIPRSACVVLVLAGLLALWPPYPPSAILASLAFFLSSRRPMPA